MLQFSLPCFALDDFTCETKNQYVFIIEVNYSVNFFCRELDEMIDTTLVKEFG